jgi:hypothetical protein
MIGSRLRLGRWNVRLDNAHGVADSEPVRQFLEEYIAGNGRIRSVDGSRIRQDERTC